MKEAKRSGDGDEELVELIKAKAYRPATSIETYLKRSSEENFPFEELDDLCDLQLETDPEFKAGNLGVEEFQKRFEEWRSNRA